MSGKWTRLYDEKAKEWRDVYIEDVWNDLRVGQASTLPPGTKTIVDRNGRPLTIPKRPIGFRP